MGTSGRVQGIAARLYVVPSGGGLAVAVAWRSAETRTNGQPFTVDLRSPERELLHDNLGRWIGEARRRELLWTFAHHPRRRMGSGTTQTSINGNFFFRNSLGRTNNRLHPAVWELAAVPSRVHGDRPYNCNESHHNSKGYKLVSHISCKVNYTILRRKCRILEFHGPFLVQDPHNHCYKRMAIHNEVPSNGIGDLHYSIVCKVFLPIFCMVLQSFLLGKHRILESPVPFPAQGRTVECLRAQLAYRAKAQKVQITGRSGYGKSYIRGPTLSLLPDGMMKYVEAKPDLATITAGGSIRMSSFAHHLEE